MSESRAQIDLTVVIPAYNAGHSLERAIVSALESGADEVIVVDDGSSDDSADTAIRAGATCHRQENAGAAQARKRGAALARTRYVAFLDADDELIPEGVRRSVDVLAADPSLAVAAGRIVVVDDDGTRRVMPIRYSPVTTRSLLERGFGPWPPAAAVVDREMYERAAGAQPPALEPRFAEDYELLIRLSLVGGIDVRDDPTCRYSLSGGKSDRSAHKAIEAKEAIREHYARHLGLDIDLLSRRQRDAAAHARRARSLWSSGMRGAAFVSAFRWFAADPLSAARTTARRSRRS